MNKLLLPLAALCLAPLAAPAAIRINEVHLNPDGSDDNFEFIELKSTTNGIESCAGLTLVIVNASVGEPGDPGNPGEIVEALNLDEFSTGANGILLLGNGYTDSPVGGPWSGAIDPQTTVGDPTGLGDSDIKSNDGLSIFLVRNYNSTAGVKGADIDKNVIGGANPITTGDGTIDWKQTPPPAGAVPQLWADADVVDSIGTLDYVSSGETAIGYRGGYVGSAATINTFALAIGSSLGQRDPDSFARQLGNDTANSASSYYGGKMNDANPTSTDILYRTGRTFGPANMLGQVTPGRPNLATTLGITDFRINEVGLNPSGSANADDRYQFVEIINTNGQSRSLSGYWLILLDSYDGSGSTNDNSPGVGGIIEEWNLSDFATGSNGLLLLGDGFSPTYTPFQDAVAPQTAVGDPAAKSGTTPSTGWSLGDLGFKDGFTLLLVRNYTPPSNKDLDATPQDGILDSSPFTIVDQIGFTQVGKTTIGRTYSAVDLRAVMAAATTPDSFARKLGNLALNSAAAWYGGNYPGGASPMTIGIEDSVRVNPGDTFAATWFGGFRGAATPGQPNLAAALDPTAPPLAASVRINEVMINPTDDITGGTDKNNEYVELASTNQGIAYLDGLYVLVVNMSGAIGEIRTGFPLNGYTTGINGLVLLGDGYDNTNGPYVINEGPLPPATAAFDPPVGLESDDFPNTASAILLVRGVKGPITLNPNGRPIGDLDPDNDGVLLDPAEYTDQLLDSIVVNTINPGAAYAWIDSTAFRPDHLARYPRNFTASTAASWYYGQIPQGPLSAPVTGYTGSFAGTFEGAGSPGRANHGAKPGPVALGSVILNEVNINPAGADNNFEFIELLSTDGTSRSLNGYSVLAIDNRINNTGSIRHAWSLDGMATGSNGLHLMGSRYGETGQNPWQPVMRPQTRANNPPGRQGLESSFSDGAIGGDTDNENVALLLVRNFNRYIDYDLDETAGAPPVDSPGDGAFDSFPWEGGSAGIHDSVVLRSYVATTPPPANPVAPYPFDGWTYGLANITAGFFPVPATLFYHPDSIARFQGETAANDPTAWYGGDLRGGDSGKSGTAEEYLTAAQDPSHPPVPAGFWGRITPGQPNLVRSATADPDTDGVASLVESAINTNPQSAASATPLPAPVTVSEAGQTYLGFSYPRLISAATPVPVPYAAEAYQYILETSPDLVTWTADPGTGANALVPVGTPAANPDGVTETVTVRLPAPVTTAPGRQYIRLRINRR